MIIGAIFIVVVLSAGVSTFTNNFNAFFRFEYDLRSSYFHGAVTVRDV